MNWVTAIIAGMFKSLLQFFGARRDLKKVVRLEGLAEAHEREKAALNWKLENPVNRDDDGLNGFRVRKPKKSK